MFQSHLEHLVAGLPSQKEVEIAPYEASEMMSSGLYTNDIGLFEGQHFRRADGNGCFHMRIHNGRFFLHRDSWDPRRFPVAHFFETPGLWGSALAILGAVALASRALE